jgi:4-carboxymuconolactone decarboxylase
MDETERFKKAMARTGVTDDELDELTFQVAAYCGAPAGVSARRAIKEMRTERATEVLS